MHRPALSTRRPRRIGRRRAGWALLLVLAALSPPGCGRDEPPETAAPPAGAQTPPRAGPTLRTVVAPAPKPTGPLPADATCVTAACHARFENSNVVHSPVALGRCDACHEPDAGGHRYPLKRPGNATCTFCHEQVGRGEHVHAPMIEPGCTACHDPHAAPAKSLLPDANVSVLCRNCHELKLERYVHGPVADGDCTLCHEPHRGENALLLRGGTGVDHCATCHVDMVAAMGKARFPHEPAADCRNCHETHTAANAHLMRRPVRQQCAACHAKVDQHAADAAVQHGAVTDETSCANCHDPHGSNHRAMLTAAQTPLCVSCHDRTQTTADGRRIENIQPQLSRRFLHGPVRDGDCGACHDVHGAPYDDLLTRRFPVTFYTDFALAKYELCFACHEQDLVLTERTTRLTGFRNGDRNLHYVHVHRAERGRTCRTCHAVHGSDHPLHVADAVPFQGSDWMMPIDFEKTETGGSCAPGCHEPESYDRGAAAGPPGATGEAAADAAPPLRGEP